MSSLSVSENANASSNDASKPGTCDGRGTCPAYPCQVCWSPPQCQTGQGICSRSQGGESIGALIVDAIGILIFFIFLMLQFWFKVTTYAVRGAKALYCADRVVQIALGIVALLVFGSLLIHVFLGSRCYSRDQTLEKRKIELQLLKKENAYKPKAAPACTTKKPEIIIKPLRISIKEPKKYKHLPWNVTRIFTVAIFDHKKKKVFESQQEVKIPENEHPPLIMAMQPIVITNYS